MERSRPNDDHPRLSSRRRGALRPGSLGLPRAPLAAPDQVRATLGDPYPVPNDPGTNWS